MAYRYIKLTGYLRGWMGYFGISEYYRPIHEIEHWPSTFYTNFSRGRCLTRIGTEGEAIKPEAPVTQIALLVIMIASISYFWNDSLC